MLSDTVSVNLGVVSYNNQPCLAIVHFSESEEFSAEQVKNVKEIARLHFQTVVTHASALFERVSDEGFKIGEATIQHTDESLKAWNVFLKCLVKPKHLDDQPEPLQRQYLGQVRFGNIPYAVVLRSSTLNEKVKSKEALQFFEQVLNASQIESQPIKSVSKDGFFAGETSVKHNNSTKAWVKLTTYLKEPDMVEYLEDDMDDLVLEGDAEFKMIDLSALDKVDLKQLASELYKKITDETNSQFPVLGENERLFLKYCSFYSDYSSFLGGKFSDKERKQLWLESEV